MWTDRRTDRHDKANRRFRYLLRKGLKKEYEISEGNTKHIIR